MCISATMQWQINDRLCCSAPQGHLRSRFALWSAVFVDERTRRASMQMIRPALPELDYAAALGPELDYRAPNIL